MIYYAKQSIDNKDLESVLRVLTNPFLTQGPENTAFSSLICSYVGTSFGLTFNSATSALYAACKALGLQENDDYWTTPNTFVATANVGVMCGAKVDFVDIDPETFNMCPEHLEYKLERASLSGNLPKIISIVHFAGEPANMERFYKLSKKYGFKIIEDASHAIGAKCDGKKIGSDSRTDVTIFSFHPVKIITTGEGGAVVTKSEEIFRKLSLFQSHGITKDGNAFKEKNREPWYYEQHELSLNFRMTELQAALGVSQLGKIENFIKRRHDIHNKYGEYFLDLPIKRQLLRVENRSALHLEIIQTNKRKEIYDYLLAQGITCNVHYIPVHTHPYYKRKFGFDWGDFDNSEQYYRQCLSLPLYPGLTDDEVDYIGTQVKSFFNDN